MKNAGRFPSQLKTAFVDQVPGMMEDIKLSIDTAEDLDRLRRLYQALYTGSGILDLKTAADWIKAGGWT